jgi:FkbM family methyltransferase
MKKKSFLLYASLLICSLSIIYIGRRVESKNLKQTEESNTRFKDYHTHCLDPVLKTNVAKIKQIQQQNYVSDCIELMYDYPCNEIDNNWPLGSLYWNELDRFTVLDSQVKTILEVGTNTGGDITKLITLYPLANFHSFEAVPKFYFQALINHETNPRVHLYPFGLFSKTQSIKMKLEDGSTTISNEGESVLLVDVKLFVELIKPDILYMNCEGCEYELISRLEQTKLLSSIKYIYMGTHRVTWYDDLLFKYCEKNRALTENNFKKQIGIPFGWEIWKNNS